MFDVCINRLIVDIQWQEIGPRLEGRLLQVEGESVDHVHGSPLAPVQLLVGISAWLESDASFSLVRNKYDFELFELPKRVFLTTPVPWDPLSSLQTLVFPPWVLEPSARQPPQMPPRQRDGARGGWRRSTQPPPQPAIGRARPGIVCLCMFLAEFLLFLCFVLSKAGKI